MDNVRFSKLELTLHRRPVAEHILAVLTEHKGEGLRFCNIKLAMIQKGWLHCDSQIVHSYQWLVENGLVKKDGFYYSIADDKTEVKSQ